MGPPQRHLLSTWFKETPNFTGVGYGFLIVMEGLTLYTNFEHYNLFHQPVDVVQNQRLFSYKNKTDDHWGNLA